MGNRKEFEREVNGKLAKLELSDNGESGDLLVNRAERLFWEQEANSLAMKLEREMVKGIEVSTRLQKQELQTKILKEEGNQMKLQYDRQIMELSEQCSLLTAKLEGSTDVAEKITFQSTSGASTVTTPTTVNNLSTAASNFLKNGAVKRPVLLSKIFK